jgi:hypothetical protein
MKRDPMATHATKMTDAARATMDNQSRLGEDLSAIEIHSCGNIHDMGSAL